jgi:hypothetical protein
MILLTSPLSIVSIQSHTHPLCASPAPAMLRPPPQCQPRGHLRSAGRRCSRHRPLAPSLTLQHHLWPPPLSTLYSGAILKTTVGVSFRYGRQMSWSGDCPMVMAVYVPWYVASSSAGLRGVYPSSMSTYLSSSPSDARIVEQRELSPESTGGSAAAPSSAVASLPLPRYLSHLPQLPPPPPPAPPAKRKGESTPGQPAVRVRMVFMLHRDIKWRWREGAWERSCKYRILGTFDRKTAQHRFVATQLVAPSANPVAPGGLPPSNPVGASRRSCVQRCKVANWTVSDGRSFTRPFRDARRLPSSGL